MKVTWPADTVYYRVIGPGRHWNDILAGKGAFYGGKQGGRYNAFGQKAVYAATDPIVSLTEFAFYEARRYQEMISANTYLHHAHKIPLKYGKNVRARLWSFQLSSSIELIDLTHTGALHAFQHSPLILHNPVRDVYSATQQLSGTVCHHQLYGPGLAAQGLQAPSVRSPVVGTYRPSQQVLLLGPHQHRLLGKSLGSWDLDLEFLDAHSQDSVTHQTETVDWRHPRFYLVPKTGGCGPLPAVPPRVRVTSMASVENQVRLSAKTPVAALT